MGLSHIIEGHLVTFGLYKTQPNYVGATIHMLSKDWLW